MKRPLHPLLECLREAGFALLYVAFYASSATLILGVAVLIQRFFA